MPLKETMKQSMSMMLTLTEDMKEFDPNIFKQCPCIKFLRKKKEHERSMKQHNYIDPHVVYLDPHETVL